MQAIEILLLDLSMYLSELSHYTDNAGSWTSVEVPIADFKLIQNFDNNLYQLKFDTVGIAPLIYMANLYFFGPSSN